MIVYLVTNKVNGKQYVGQTSGTLQNRWTEHCRIARKGEGHAMQAAIRKYGKDEFSAEVIERCGSREELNAAEPYWIEWYQTLSPCGYNLDTGGDVKQASPETRAKISAAQIGKKRGPHSEEHKQKISLAQKGRALSSAHRLALSKAKIGKPSNAKGTVRTPEMRAHQRQLKIGKKLSPEHRAKLSVSLMGNTNASKT